jgi:hypothetical protein
MIEYIVIDNQSASLYVFDSMLILAILHSGLHICALALIFTHKYQCVTRYRRKQGIYQGIFKKRAGFALFRLLEHLDRLTYQDV